MPTKKKSSTLGALDWKWVIGAIVAFLLQFGAIMQRAGQLQSDVQNIKDVQRHQQELLDRYFQK